MDGLALLCNLFADGPVTLRRLRAAGVRALGDLERAAPEELGTWLHTSVPHASRFAAEARRLACRLAEQEGEPRPEPRRAPASPAPEPAPAVSSAPGRREHGQPLRPGLFPGLDESTCLRLQAQQVYTTRTLIEFTSLSLARRSGIPYANLLELARRARRLVPSETCAGDALAPERLAAVQPALAAPRSPEPARTDEFSWPTVEPDSAGPFG